MPSNALRHKFLFLFSYAVIGFIYLPLIVIGIYAFTVDDITFAFPPTGFTTHWFGQALPAPICGMRCGFRSKLLHFPA